MATAVNHVKETGALGKCEGSLALEDKEQEIVYRNCPLAQKI